MLRLCPQQRCCVAIRMPGLRRSRHDAPDPVSPTPTSRMSLSMDLGTPTTEHTTPCASHSSAMAWAAALPPLPPTTNTMLSPHRSMRLTISLMLAPPRDVP